MLKIYHYHASLLNSFIKQVHCVGDVTDLHSFARYHVYGVENNNSKNIYRYIYWNNFNLVSVLAPGEQWRALYLKVVVQINSVSANKCFNHVTWMSFVLFRFSATATVPQPSISLCKHQSDPPFCGLLWESAIHSAFTTVASTFHV